MGSVTDRNISKNKQGEKCCNSKNHRQRALPYNVWKRFMQIRPSIKHLDARVIFILCRYCVITITPSIVYCCISSFTWTACISNRTFKEDRKRSYFNSDNNETCHMLSYYFFYCSLYSITSLISIYLLHISVKRTLSVTFGHVFSCYQNNLICTWFD